MGLGTRNGVILHENAWTRLKEGTMRINDEDNEWIKIPAKQNRFLVIFKDNFNKKIVG